MVARARGPTRPFMGHKGAPFLQSWIAADWATNMPDKMHDVKCFTECVVKCLVGHAGDEDGTHYYMMREKGFDR